MLKRDYPSLATFCSKEMPFDDVDDVEAVDVVDDVGPIWVPEKYLFKMPGYFFDTQEMVTRSESDQRTGHMVTAAADHIENHFWNKWREREKYQNLPCCIFLHGLQLYVIGKPKGQNEREIDLVLIHLPLRTVFIMEIKSTLKQAFNKKKKEFELPMFKAGEQLKESRNLIADYFQNDLNSEWKCATIILANQIDDDCGKERVCEDC